jgi:hypothetical protein
MENSQDTLALSDEEFMKHVSSQVEPAAVEAQPEEETVTEPTAEEVPANKDLENTDNATAEDAADDSETETETTEAESDSSEEDEATADTDESEASAISDSELKRILEPFKANGRDFQVKDVDEALTLMKMGANYHKKMTVMKPGLRVLKMLEEHSLMDEQKLNYLIDLSNKNPEAIKRLIKDSGIDPLDVDEQSGNDYKPTQYQADDKRVAIEEVLDSIKDSPTYGETMQIITEQWDGSSRKILSEQPQVIATLNAHKEAGIFDAITAEVERERTFGRLQNMSDLEAYKHVGDRLYASKAGNSEMNPVGANEVEKPTANKPDPKEVSRKKAAGVSRSTVGKAPVVQEQTDPWAMSDAEFEKHILAKYR